MLRSDASNVSLDCTIIAGTAEVPRIVLPSPLCGRYVRRSDKQKIAEHFAVHGPSRPDFGPSWNVAPQTFQPVVRLDRDTGERELVLMRWGLIPYWAKDEKIGLRTINSRVVRAL